MFTTFIDLRKMTREGKMNWPCTTVSGPFEPSFYTVPVVEEKKFNYVAYPYPHEKTAYDYMLERKKEMYPSGESK